MWKNLTRGVRQTLQRRLCDCPDVPAHQDVQTNKNQGQFISLTRRLANCFCEILCNQTAETISRPCGSNNEKEHHTNNRWNTYTNLGTQHTLWGAVGWSSALVLGWVISQPIWHKHMCHHDNKSESEQDDGPNLLNLLYKWTNGGQALTYVLPHKGAASAPELAIENHDSLEKAFDEAAEELRIVHEKAVGEAENRRGVLYLSQHRNGEAIKHFRRASHLKYAPGAFNLAQCYELGIGTKQDFKQAAEWYKVASDQGHATAMYNLGVFYAHGWGGLEASSVEARKLFRKAAKLGQADAQAALDIHQGSTKDTKEISLVDVVDKLNIKPINMSSTEDLETNNYPNHTEAKFGGFHNGRSRTGPKFGGFRNCPSHTEAKFGGFHNCPGHTGPKFGEFDNCPSHTGVKFEGFHNCPSHMGPKFGGFQNKMLMYEPDAKEYYKGLCREYGWGVPVDMAVAAEHYSKAALDGNSSAMYNLAAYFEKTAVNGMSKDADIMIQLYKMAADQGHVQASTRLQALQT